VHLRAHVGHGRKGVVRVRGGFLIRDRGRVLHDRAEPLLRDTQLFLRLSALGHVEQEPLPVCGHPVGVPDQHGLLVHPDGAAVGSDHPVVDRQRFAGGIGLLHRGERPLTVLWVQDRLPELEVHQPARRRVPEDRSGLWAYVIHSRRARRARFRRLRIDHGRHLLDQHPEALLGLSESLLRLLAAGDVDHEALEVVDRTVIPKHGNGRVAHPYRAAVGARHPILLIEGRDVVGVERAVCLHAGEVVGMHQARPQGRVVHEVLCGVAEDPSICGLTNPIRTTPFSAMSVYVTAGIRSTKER
jgi:hypothetical protein